jgi:hypothetical protein
MRKSLGWVLLWEIEREGSFDASGDEGGRIVNEGEIGRGRWECNSERDSSGRVRGDWGVGIGNRVGCDVQALESGRKQNLFLKVNFGRDDPNSDQMILMGRNNSDPPGILEVSHHDLEIESYSDGAGRMRSETAQK